MWPMAPYITRPIWLALISPSMEQSYPTYSRRIKKKRLWATLAVVTCCFSWATHSSTMFDTILLKGYRKFGLETGLYEHNRQMVRKARADTYMWYTGLEIALATVVDDKIRAVTEVMAVEVKSFVEDFKENRDGIYECGHQTRESPIGPARDTVHHVARRRGWMSTAANWIPFFKDYTKAEKIEFWFDEYSEALSEADRVELLLYGLAACFILFMVYLLVSSFSVQILAVCRVAYPICRHPFISCIQLFAGLKSV
eukprot:Lankesteria_metandrocarpae@DN6393_c0_g1_i1.p1